MFDHLSNRGPLMVQPRAALSRISQAKNRMETPEDIKSSGWSLRDQQVSKVYEMYRRTLQNAGVVGNGGRAPKSPQSATRRPDRSSKKVAQSGDCRWSTSGRNSKSQTTMPRYCDNIRCGQPGAG